MFILSTNLVIKYEETKQVASALFDETKQVYIATARAIKYISFQLFNVFLISKRFIVISVFFWYNVIWFF